MPESYSKPGVKWDGFRPIGYSFSEQALNLPLKQIKGHGDQKQEEDTSIGKLLQDLEGKDFKVDDLLSVIDINTESDTLTLRGPSFNLQLASELLELQKRGDYAPCHKLVLV